MAEVITSKPSKSKDIDLRDKVEVVSTDKDKHHVTGSTFKVHPEVAAALIKKGFAKEVKQEATK